MKNNYILAALLALLLIAAPAQASFKNIKFNKNYSCNTNSVKGTLSFVAGAPNGTYYADIDVTDETIAPNISIDGVSLADGAYTKEFKIPRDESGGLDFTVTVDSDFIASWGPSFELMPVPFSIMPGDETTQFTGFGSTTGTMNIEDTGCGDSEEEDSVAKNLAETLVGADDPTFEDVNTATLISTEVDLVVNFTYKVDKTAYDLFTTFNDLDEGDITERAKELAGKFGIKLDIKNLKKLANKELKDAGKGLKGEEKQAAIDAAKETGINKLLSEIQMKLPELPPKSDPERREKVKIIRKAKKAKILEGLEIELVSTTDSTMDGKSVKCLSFKITLPAKICAKDDGSQTLVIGGLNIMNLEVGESVTIDIPVKVTGVFKQFFGDSGKNGKNGKINIPLTLTNPAEE